MTNGEELTFKIAEFNWRLLTDEQEQLREWALMEGLAKASEHNVDVIMSSEIGATIKTKHLQGTRYQSDWATSKHATFGQGVGMFIDEKWEGRWAPIPSSTTGCNSRIYIATIGSLQILLLVYYAPHAGNRAEHRLQFYKSLWQLWQEVSGSFPNSWHIIAGDANIPDLFQGTPPNRVISPRGKAARFFQRTFLTRYNIANATAKGIQSNHTKGGTLGLTLIDSGIQIVNHITTATGIAGSDHAMDITTMAIPGYAKAPEPMIWHAFPDANWNKCGEDMQPALESWHGWLNSQLASGKQPVSQNLASDADLLFTFIVLATLWREKSPYGTFTNQHRSTAASPWWNKECTETLKRLQRSRGKQDHKEAKSAYHRALRKAESHQWETKIKDLEETSSQLPPTAHKHIKEFMHPFKIMSPLLRVGDTYVSGGDAHKLMAKHFEAQASLEGPQPAEFLWEQIHTNTEESNASAVRISENQQANQNYRRKAMAKISK